MTTDLCGRHFIAHEWHQSEASFTRFNPSTNSVLPGAFSQGTVVEVEAAAIAADAAFWEFQQTSADQKAKLLETMAKEIEQDGDAIVACAMLESGLPEARLKGELGRTAGQLRLFASVLREPYSPLLMDKANPDRQPLPKPELKLGQLPLGVVAVFGASNFPLAFSTAGGDTASALAAGCAVIVKGHPSHPGTSELVARAMARAIDLTGMPKGLFSLIQGSEPALSVALVEHPLVKAVGFTGSLKVGRLLADRCALRPEPIPFYGELGSVNPQLLLPGKLARDAAVLAEAQVNSMMMGHGQFCTSPGLVIAIKGPGLESYLAALSDIASRQNAAAMLSAGICQAFNQDVSILVPRVNVIAQGQAAEAAHHSRPLIASIEASALFGQPELLEEIFGPFALVAICDSKEEMFELVKRLPGQLTGSIHGLETEVADFGDIIDRLAFKVGRIMFNQMPTGVEVARAMNHGGPYPASTDGRSTSVGAEAMKRFMRPICYQNMPETLLPNELKASSRRLMMF
ncbi:aldehyde dehydrogenase (NADP(+)) [Shewanella amazonensis]|uniref:Fatty aldehyde dehydrogenase n=1 Tax=Shewanella amazonensis (strain ATCC BAA-1098 / SB2B) TaxID=326297 RepID=A1S5T0_SHEAM|nr:aldehyde dehydrogenase (NADP(+)) [Shewanella amazonensis]ABL99736.1 fatty aldehyde dehydrogenase [Shewanella amazonensis SB2B]